MLLRNPFPNAFGLEIGDLSLKLVQLKSASMRKQNCFDIAEIREIRLPAGLIVNGEIQQPELVRKKLMHLLGKDETKKYSPIKTSWVVAGLPEVKTFLKMITIEGEPGDVSEVDVLYQAKKHLPFELEDAYVSWQIFRTSQKEGFVRILIAAVPKLICNTYIYLLESVQLTPLALELEAISLARSMITANKEYTGEARAILDLGATRSSLIIYDNNTIQFSTSINFSGEIVTTAIEQAMKINHQKAEEMKIKNGAKFDGKNSKYLNAINKLNNQLINELNSAISFYKEHFNNQNIISHITMCGGMSNWKGLDNFISSKLKISSNPGNVWKNLKNDKIIKNKENGLELAAAVGLALRAAQRPFII